MIMPYGPILFHDITYVAIIIMKTLFLQTMKNASCKKLIIDRSKAKKVGTLKDSSCMRISHFLWKAISLVV